MKSSFSLIWGQQEELLLATLWWTEHTINIICFGTHPTWMVQICKKTPFNFALSMYLQLYYLPICKRNANHSNDKKYVHNKVQSQTFMVGCMLVGSHNSSFNIVQFILSLLDDRHQNLTNQDWNQETNFCGELFVQFFITWFVDSSAKDCIEGWFTRCQTFDQLHGKSIKVGQSNNDTCNKTIVNFSQSLPNANVKKLQNDQTSYNKWTGVTQSWLE